VKRAPERTCIGCRQARAKSDLIRLIRADDGRVKVDWKGKDAGRGAYVCASMECLVKALGQGRLGHAFRRPSAPPEATAAAIIARRGGG
jgi:hypothetical protein